MKLRWRFGLFAALCLALFSLSPQVKLWYHRGAEWQGNYAYNDIDEVAYASYVQALVEGRPRKNDPYTGNDDSPDHPQPESLFSIQFAAPYTLAIPGRILGISTPWLMTVGGCLAAFLTALAVFWFLFRLTTSNWYAMAGSVITLAGGALFAGEGAVSEVFFDGFSYPYFPGFRRYIPALAMPAFFGLVGWIWSLLSDENGRADSRRVGPVVPLLICLAAFAYAVYSYFYIWTMAAAWMACLCALWIVFRPDNFKAGFRWLLVLAAGCGLILLPYAYLLSKRSHTMDDVQLLVRTHAPDLTRFPEYIAALVVIILAVGVASRRLEARQPSTVFVLSLAMSVFTVFNQQVITGQSLQPIHYQVFIGNYVAGLALVASVGLLIRNVSVPESTWKKSAFAVLTAAAVGWGLVECYYTVRVLDGSNIARDEQVPLARRLTDLAKDEANPYKTVVLHLSIGEADDLPTLAPQATLWARHQHVFTTVTTEENKIRYYQYLYYQGITGADLSQAMKHGDFVSMIALFGWGRHTGRLNPDFKPLTYGEIESEAATYDTYVADFDPHRSPETIVSYVVVRSDEQADLSNFDLWYERDRGERYGPYTLYKAVLRSDRGK